MSFLFVWDSWFGDLRRLKEHLQLRIMTTSCEIKLVKEIPVEMSQMIHRYILRHPITWCSIALKQEKGTNGCHQLLLTPCPWKKLRFHHLHFPSWVTKHPVRVTDSLCYFSLSPSFCDTFAFSHNANASFSFHHGGQKYRRILPKNVTTSFQKINYQHTNENAAIWQHVKKLSVTVKKTVTSHLLL